MPVPKRKRSRPRKNKRFANKGLKVKAFSLCKNCEEPLIPHIVCKGCGFFKGIKIFATKAERSEKRRELRKVISDKRQARQTAQEATAQTNNSQS